MDRNSSKPAETGNPQVYALEVTRGWLEQVGGRRRIPSALEALLEATQTAVARGEPPPEKDSLTLTELWRLSKDDFRQHAVTPLRGREVERWWAAREEHLRQVCADCECQWMPHLVVRIGGGRGLPSQFTIELRPFALPESEPGEDLVDTGPGVLRYRIDPIKPALWLRLLVGSRPFPINSWRGYVLLGSIVLNFIVIGAIVYELYVSWSHPRTITTAELATVALAAVVSYGLWVLTRPVRQLHTHRVTLAGASFIAFSELYGQLRTMREPGGKFAGRVFSVVRHWGTCPICAADVDVASGGAAFPDRLVGRCHDAPLEHVFSFDPVRLVGEPLRRH